MAASAATPPRPAQAEYCSSCAAPIVGRGIRCGQCGAFSTQTAMLLSIGLLWTTVIALNAGYAARMLPAVANLAALVGYPLPGYLRAYATLLPLETWGALAVLIVALAAWLAGRLPRWIRKGPIPGIVTLAALWWTLWNLTMGFVFTLVWATPPK